MHKVFISYHHANDQWYKDNLVQMGKSPQDHLLMSRWTQAIYPIIFPTKQLENKFAMTISVTRRSPSCS